jgi:hypothetical protein
MNLVMPPVSACLGKSTPQIRLGRIRHRQNHLKLQKQNNPIFVYVIQNATKRKPTMKAQQQNIFYGNLSPLLTRITGVQQNVEPKGGHRPISRSTKFFCEQPVVSNQKFKTDALCVANREASKCTAVLVSYLDSS